jgi:ribosomal protein L29
MRKISEMTDEELEAAAQEAREELAKMTGEDRALVQEAIPKAVH